MAEAPRGTTRVLCLGNDLIADDGLGPGVAAELRSRSVAAEVAESALDGLGLLDDLLGAERLIVIDVIVTGHQPPGTIRVLSEQDLAADRGGWQHALGLFDTIGLARALGLEAPREVVLVVVEAGDLVRVGGPLTPDVARAVPGVATLVEGLLEGVRDA